MGAYDKNASFFFNYHRTISRYTYATKLCKSEEPAEESGRPKLNVPANSTFQNCSQPQYLMWSNATKRQNSETTCKKGKCSLETNFS